MITNQFNSETLSMADSFGPVLYRRETGQAVADHFSELGQNRIIVADFEGVEVVGANFLKIAFEGIKNRAPERSFRAPMIAFRGLSEDIRAEVELVLSSPHSPIAALAVRGDGQLGVVTRLDGARAAFDAATQLTAENGSFLVRDLAKTINIGTPDANTRLNVLRQAAAVARWHERFRDGAPRYIYRSLIDDDVAL